MKLVKIISVLMLTLGLLQAQPVNIKSSKNGYESCRENGCKHDKRNEWCEPSWYG